MDGGKSYPGLANDDDDSHYYKTESKASAWQQIEDMDVYWTSRASYISHMFVCPTHFTVQLTSNFIWTLFHTAGWKNA